MIKTILSALINDYIVLDGDISCTIKVLVSDINKDMIEEIDYNNSETK